FQSSLLRCSHCDFQSSGSTSPQSPLFQSSLLRCSYCDIVFNVSASTPNDLVSILFTVVFLLLPVSSTQSCQRSQWFQSSLLRCSYCDLELQLKDVKVLSRFNPLY